MILRLLVPSTDHPGPDLAFAWSLADSRGQLLRQGADPLSSVPRADAVEAILPVSRVLHARLRLPRVNAATIRELLPFAVEDRLLADPSQIHAVPGATNARGETLVAVVDRAWLRQVLDVLASARLVPARAFCESALLPVQRGRWHAVLGGRRSFLVEDDGHAVAFDPPAGSDPPLAVRIACDEAAEGGNRPEELHVFVEDGVTRPDPGAWSERTATRVTVAEAPFWLTAPRAAGAIDLLTGEFVRPAAALSGLRLPRLAWGLAAAIAIGHVGFTAAHWWRLESERRALEAERESLFRAAFPEAKTVVDPALQMRRNLGDLERARGRASADDFLARVAEAAGSNPAPARRLRYAAGKLDIERGSSP